MARNAVVFCGHAAITDVACAALPVTTAHLRLTVADGARRARLAGEPEIEIERLFGSGQLIVTVKSPAFSFLKFAVMTVQVRHPVV